MRIGIEIEERELLKTMNILRKVEESELSSILVSLLENNVTSSDILFMILEELERRGIISGRGGKIKFVREIGDELINNQKNKILRKIRGMSKIFVTPLEVSKFYLCPRRLWLEKVVLAKQEKEERGRVWDGEAVHFAAKLLFDQFPEHNPQEIVNRVFEKYEDRITLTKEKILRFVKNLANFIEEEGLEKIFPEKTLVSLRIGLVGTPDAIAIKEDEIFPIDIKLGKVRKLRREHMLQSVGEALLIQNFFRKKVNKGCLIYFDSDSLFYVSFKPELKRLFLNYRRLIERTFSSPFIPRKGNIPNLRRRVCQGCHVRRVCEQMESLMKKRFKSSRF
jgi:CRISPR/Cas system-associated exonuclease Cas4 (RecB family)